jgi:hypothetical protein
MKKKHHTKEQMLAVYTDWQQSGLGKKNYCNQIGLATSTFFYWAKKFAQNTECPGALCPAPYVDSGFRELDFPTHAGVVLEIEYPSGARIKLYRQVEANWIKSLL